jgi:hypothetical protein
MDIDKITLEEFLKQFNMRKKHDEAIKELESMMTQHKMAQEQFAIKIRKIEVEYYLPNIAITEIYPKAETKKTENKSVKYPHLRAVAAYEVAGKKKRFNIFLGPLDQFPDGKDDEKALELAKHKAFNYLKKHHPNLFK